MPFCLTFSCLQGLDFDKVIALHSSLWIRILKVNLCSGKGTGNFYVGKILAIIFAYACTQSCSHRGLDAFFMYTFILVCAYTHEFPYMRSCEDESYILNIVHVMESNIRKIKPNFEQYSSVIRLKHPLLLQTLICIKIRI